MRENLCHLLDNNRVLVGTGDFFQVWEWSSPSDNTTNTTPNNTNSKIMVRSNSNSSIRGKGALLYQGEVPGGGSNVNNFLFISFYRNSVVGSHSNHTITLWDIGTQGEDKRQGRGRREQKTGQQ